jgi:multiple antibiotic resistance protein
MSWTAFGETFVTLLVIMDPLGAAPIFMSLTAGMSRSERRAAAIRAASAALALVLVFALVGDLLLRYLNVSIDSLSIAGGLLLLLLSLEMLRGVDFPTGPGGDVALVPLASPLVAGPGAIATAMVLSREHPSAGGRAAVLLGIAAAAITVGISLILAERVARRLPPTVVHFLTRVLGLVLAAIGVELIVTGIRGAIGG